MTDTGTGLGAEPIVVADRQLLQVRSPITSLADVEALEREKPWADRVSAKTVYQQLLQTAGSQGCKPAASFQLSADPRDPGVTLSWTELKGRITQAANLFRSLGVADEDAVAYLLPTTHDTLIALMGAMTAGKAAPINPTLEPLHIAALLRESGAKVLVTLKSFPQTNLAQLAHAAAANAPNIKSVIEIDLLPYIPEPTRRPVDAMRPPLEITHNAQVLDFAKALAAQPADALTFEESQGDRVCALFHTGGTTGMPKIAQHRQSGILYNGWLCSELVYTPDEVVLCPVPLFHVFAAYPIWAGVLSAGAHVVFPTAGGYRGEGVLQNFWKLIEKWRVTFMTTVPTAAAALMQVPVDADISSLKGAFCGSAPLPQELFRRFVEATGVEIQEGYGMTEATCLVSVNPGFGERRIGSVGFRYPYTDIRIVDGQADVEPGGIGEICVANPGVLTGETYTDPTRNEGLYLDNTHLRTGDLGRVDDEGYLWITGRAKDMIIRGGHNVDPAMIEDGLAGHPAVAFVGAIGQPDEKAGELPCAYVELVDGANASVEDLMAFAAERIPERAAHPKHLEILNELPKTAVGKVFKPALRKLAITRIYDAALKEAGLAASVQSVTDDKQLGLTAQVAAAKDIADDQINAALGGFTRPWVRQT
ncbi:acyl-CoA synthetase [Ruegeria sp. Ofav3-42]|uniref:acyl-CoA synthetase n=1 Tax=Ruegeria sp. Ofav3-42 TaxID=2917759 RepID=UPI001EF51854|nr:acyl-CoA synthetase [Ruegeria sp. Ofav3-42]MCG7522050.1 acyl-CoA synthetase [Ruegeria sp. Ofav3-42]